MKRILLTLIALFSLGSFVLVGQSAFAQSATQNDVCQGIGLADPSGVDCSVNSTGTSVDGVIKTVITILSWVVGVASVIVVIVSGLKYITSGGDSNKVSSAKTTLIYALVGVLIAVLAQVLVKFVLSKTIA